MEAGTDFTQAYDRLAAEFPIPRYIDESLRYQMQFVVNFIREYVPEFEGRRLLDIGSGPMNKTAIFQFLGFSCSAADDLSDPWHQRDDNVKKIKAFANTTGINFFQQQSDNYAIPFAPNSFDIVCSHAVIEHLHESPRGLLNTMGTFAKDDGLILVGMPNSVNLRKRLSVLMGKSNHVPIDQFYHSTGVWRGHVREYTLSETAYICGEAGFEVLSSRTCEDLAQTKLKPPLRNLYVLAGKLIPTLRSSLLVLCRKPKNWTPREANDALFRSAIKRSIPDGIA